jgi:hypothetical protein
MRALCAAGLSLALFGCSSDPAGEPAAGFINAPVAAAYIPLEGSRNLFLIGRGAAVVIAPGIAATNAHNSNLVDDGTVIGASADYDLLYFRTLGMSAPAFAEPRLNEAVIAYGQGSGGQLREARGVVSALAIALPTLCQGCRVQYAFSFDANGGKGFSGGPVVDAANGSVLGIVFGFEDRGPGGRLMYAYDMAHVMAEFARFSRSETSQNDRAESRP